jgi:RND family efflux transporter MFP subunit
MKMLKFVVFACCTSVLLAQQAVEVTRVTMKPVERQVHLPGEFLPYLQVDIYSRVPAFVDQINIDRGSQVQEGDLLAVLNAPEMSAQVAEAEAKVKAVESQRAEAESRAAAAESTYDRTKQASKTAGAVAENELILAQKTFDAARALERSLEDQEAAARDSLKALQELLGYLRITAPFAGVITARNVHPGALVGPGGSQSTPLVRLEQVSRLRLVVAVPEAEVSGIVRGAHVPFTVPAYPSLTFEGIVARVAHSIDSKTRTMAVEMDVHNADGRLAPGMYPDVFWPVRKSTPSLMVPPTSIVTTTERTFVVRVKDGVVQWVNVKRGVSIGNLVEVYGPLAAGDAIVRRASDELREGARVTVRDIGS